MRKLSRKWPGCLTVIAFTMPGFYLFHRIITYPGTFRGTEFAGKLFAAAFFSGIAWVVYGLTCVLARKPECPNCGGKQVAKYLYGIPKITKEIERDVEAGRIVLGGVKDKKDSPIWYCNDCQHEW